MKPLPAGAKAQVFGAVLVLLGLLVVLFSRILGFVLDGFYLVLLASGLALFAYGALRRRGSGSQGASTEGGAASPPPDSPAEGHR